MDTDLQHVINNLQALANKLATEGRLTEATVAWSGIIAVQALRTKLDPPKAPAPATKALAARPKRRAKNESP